jgi:hypothetical protein
MLTDDINCLAMKLKLILSGLLISCFVYGQEKTPNDTIHWSENRKISWDDFKGKPQIYTGFIGEAFCMNAGFYDKPNALSEINFRVYSIFDRTKSWVNPEARSEYGLLYFQVMFNIYEKHARMLRKTLSETKFGKDVNSVFMIKYNDSMTALSDEFNEFRNDTRMGQDKGALLRWDKQVQADLKLLEKYK